MADGEALQLLAGAVSQLAEDGRQGEVEPGAAGKESRGAGAASGGVESDAEQQLPGRLLAAAAIAAGGAQGDHGDGAQAGADRIPPDALRGGVREADGGGVCGAGAGAVEKQLHRRARELGYTLTKVETAAAASVE